MSVAFDTPLLRLTFSRILSKSLSILTVKTLVVSLVPLVFSIPCLLIADPPILCLLSKFLIF